MIAVNFIDKHNCPFRLEVGKLFSIPITKDDTDVMKPFEQVFLDGVKYCSLYLYNIDTDFKMYKQWL